MKTINQLINFLLSLIGINRRILTAYIQNNYIVYIKDKDFYYNILPLKINQSVWYKTELDTYEQCTILTLLPNQKFYVHMERYGTETSFVTNRDKLFAYIPETKVKGYINGINFIVTDDYTNKEHKPTIEHKNTKLNMKMIAMMF